MHWVGYVDVLSLDSWTIKLSAECVSGRILKIGQYLTIKSWNFVAYFLCAMPYILLIIIMTLYQWSPVGRWSNAWHSFLQDSRRGKRRSDYDWAIRYRPSGRPTSALWTSVRGCALEAPPGEWRGKRSSLAHSHWWSLTPFSALNVMTSSAAAAATIQHNVITVRC